MKISRISTQLFRGDEEPIDIQNYDHEFATKKLQKDLAASMSHGPGLYFTISKENAYSYGKNITEKSLNPNAKILTEQSPKLSFSQINKILQDVPEDTMEIAASSWDENYNLGKKTLIQNIIEGSDDPIEQLMDIWSGVLFHQNPNLFIQMMINNGIDGIAVVIPNASDPSNNDTHYIIYNKNVLI